MPDPTNGPPSLRAAHDLLARRVHAIEEENRAERLRRATLESDMRSAERGLIAHRQELNDLHNTEPAPMPEWINGLADDLERLNRGIERIAACAEALVDRVPRPLVHLVRAGDVPVVTMYPSEIGDDGSLLAHALVEAEREAADHRLSPRERENRSSGPGPTWSPEPRVAHCPACGQSVPILPTGLLAPHIAYGPMRLCPNGGAS